MPYTVFISHAGEDIWAAWHLAQDVKNAGADYFLDQEDILAGDEFEQKILERLAAADELWVLLTPYSLGRPYVWLEVGVARARNMRIVPIVLGMSIKEIQKADNVPQLVKRGNIVETCNVGKFKRFLAAFSERVRRAGSAARRAGAGGARRARRPSPRHKP